MSSSSTASPAPGPVVSVAEKSKTTAPSSFSRSGPHITRARAYAFVLDDEGEPIELGSGRYAKAFLGEEHWLQSKTGFSRRVAIKILQAGISSDDALRFQMEKELLERAQGHPNIITLHASGEADNPDFVPRSLRGKVLNDFMVLELCDLSLEERLKGSRNRSTRENLLKYTPRERVFRVLDYMIPVAASIEYAHLIRGICHRDIKPANVLLRLPNPNLCGSTLDVRLADFNVGKLREEGTDLSLTQLQSVPGTIFFQSPEQETNAFELLVNVQRGTREVDYFEDFFIYIQQNDIFQIFNRPEQYRIIGADREKKKIYLEKPFAEPGETNVRGKVTKSVDRSADIYSLGAMFYYLVSGAYANPKSFYDAFHKFIEYEGGGEQNTIDAYVEHEYRIIENLRAPKTDEEPPQVAPADRFFSYKHYLDGNGELIDKEVMKIITQAMIRNKRDSYCQAWDINTTGISEFVAALRFLYDYYGMNAAARPAFFSRYAPLPKQSGPLRRAWSAVSNSLHRRARGASSSRNAARSPSTPTKPV
ncbi:MAG: protein kinase [Deltaproteobacteria bacterium]|nr:protein kinase [Deltaproteobacteria bacterium]